MRIKSVKRVQLPTPVPVFDITVHGTENFKLAYGPYVHNSKDCSDSLAGVVYGLTMRREIWGMYGIQPVQIPESVWGVLKKIKEGKDEVKA